MKLPIKKQDTWYHVGDLSKKEKKDSYEGSGLSISDVPLSWKKIAQLSGEIFELKKKGGRFLDIHNLSDNVREDILSWAVHKGFLIQRKVWIYKYFDDEFNSFYEMEFESKENLYKEISWEDMDEEEQNYLLNLPEDNEDKEMIFEEVRYNSTNTLLELENWSGVCNSSLSEDFAILRYVDEVLGLDGVYWDDLHDVSRFSAPRAVIFQSKLTEWTYKKEVS